MRDLGKSGGQVGGGAELVQEGVDLGLELGALVEVFDEAGGDLGSACGDTQEGADDGAAVAVVASDVGVGDEAGFEVAGIFPGEVEGGGEGFVDVAGGADTTTDDDVVGIAGPELGFAFGEPGGAVSEDGIAQRGAVDDGAGHFDQGIGGGEDFGGAMGECDMSADGLLSGGEIASEVGAEESDVGEAADVDVVGGALVRGGAASVGGEEAAVALFDVGVPVLAGSEHEVEVALEVVVGVVAFAGE